MARIELRKVQKTRTGFILNIPKSWEPDLGVIPNMPVKMTLQPDGKVILEFMKL